MMRKFILALVLCALSTGVSQGKPRYANPDVFEVNREPAHAFSHVFPDVESARPEPDWENPFAKSSRYLYLNGTWKFKWTENLATAPKDFFAPNFDAKAWDDIQVPLPWQMVDYGQIYYYNCRMPMLMDRRNLSEDAPPEVAGVMDVTSPKVHNGARQREAANRAYIPEKFNPIGSYLTEFDLPNEWDGMRVVLHFSGVKSGFTCWVNGQEVGYSQDAFTPAEFDITRYLKPGKNHLAVQVIRWTDGAYLENQDRIRLSGIIRDVYLFATPKAHIGDFFIQPDVTQSLERAEFSVDVALRNTDTTTAKNRSLEVELIDPSGKTVLTQKVKFPAVESGSSASVTLESKLADPLLWHTEEPHLYTALIKLFENGKVAEVIRQDVGFRRFDWDEKGNTYLNGKRYYMRGVNRSDCSPETGYYVDYADMLADAVTMKELNIDSVRTSHNASDIRWYAICNRMGITLVDEANVEAHQHDVIFNSDAPQEAAWRKQSVWRMENMVQRDKNQPSIIIWSVGNEQFPYRENVPTIKAMFDATEAIDSTRGIICERSKEVLDFVEILAPMYGGEKDYVERYQNGTERRPFFLSEYSHAMGNTDMRMEEKWAYFEEHDGLNGGHIWDWRDQSVLYPLPGLEGRHLTYGGDWSQHSGNDGTFCMNGIVLPDRGFTGKSYETKGIYQQAAMLPSESQGKVRGINKFGMQNLDQFSVEVALLKDGVQIDSKPLALSLAPQSDTEIDVPFDLSALDPQSDYHLNYDVSWNEQKLWADAGTVFARGQVQLQQGEGTKESLTLDGSVHLKETASQITVKAGATVVSFDKEKKLLTQITSAGKNLLLTDDTLAGVELNLTFHPTDDYVCYSTPFKKDHFKFERNLVTREAGAISVKETSESRITVETENKYLLLDGKRGYLHKASYTILPSGVIQVDNVLQAIDLAEEDFLLRVGVRIPVAQSFDMASYLACGPYENYEGRKAWNRYGVHQHDALDFFSRYVRPQECGNRSDLKWIALQDDKGVGLEVVGEQSGNGSVMPWTSEVFATADHIPQLPESKRWILRYDDQLPGIGKWSKLDIEDDYAFSYSIRPLAKGVNPAEVAVPKVPDSVKTKSSLNPAPAKKASKKAPKEAAKKELPVAESRPKGWKCVSEKASVEYSTTTKFAKFPDTLLTTQASPFAFHTDSEKAPWLIVDLKKSVPVSGLLIQNREDSLFKRVNNLHVWVSDDKASWKQVFETKGAKKEWLVKLDAPTTARYVKVGMLNGDKPEFFHLKGLRIFGP
jgi:beta-galactosidase